MLQPEFSAADYRLGLEKFLEDQGERAVVSLDYLVGEFTDFVRRYCNPDFTEIFDVRDPNYFFRLENTAKRDRALYRLISVEQPLLGKCFKTLNAFYASKFRPQPKLNANKRVKPESNTTSPSQPAAHKDFPAHNEGARREMEMERAYRNRAARNACVSHWGAQCQVCGILFADDYGELGTDFIEVHHLQPISSFDGEHVVDPIEDLAPLCSNCHSMIHHSGATPMTLGELREKYRGPKRTILKFKP